MEYNVGRLQRIDRGNRDEARVTGPGAGEKDVPRLRRCIHGYAGTRIAAGSISFSTHHASYAMGEISDGFISLRPPQKTFV